MFTRKDIFIGFLFLMLCFNSFSQDFITTWTVSAGDLKITIPTRGSGYDCTVDWGDSGPTITTHSGTSPVISHTYASAGTYQITISATTFGDTSPFPRIYFNELGDKDKIISIDQWGSNQWTSMVNAFRGCSLLVNNATDVPDLSNLTSMQRMFGDALKIGDGSATNWNSWDLSNVQNVLGLFNGAIKFNENIKDWFAFPSSVTNMSSMFYGATAFDNGGADDLNNWDTSSVALMTSMFRQASAFNRDISGWDVEEVTSMSTMFRAATSFNQDLGWTTTKLEVISNMFRNATAFDGDISGWDVDLVTTMASMFQDAPAFNQNIGSWTVTDATTNMDNMFYNASSFNQDLNSWDVSKVTNMSDMFRGTPFNGNITSWVTSSTLNMSNMFNGATAFNQNISSWTTSSVSNFTAMFRGATAFNQNIGGWITSSAVNTSQMFYDATAFNQDIGSWILSSVSVMNNMFRGATAFNQDIGGWNTSSTTNMNNMFRDATSFDQDISGWNVSLVTNFGNMFRDATLSPANYNALLVGWNAQTLQPGEAFHGGNSQYCSAAAVAAKANMISSDGWSFSDGGQLTSFTWTGSTDTDWNDSSNWLEGYTSDCALDVTIPSVTNHPIIDASTEITVNDLTIDSGASLIVNGGITVSGNLTTNDGLTINSAGSLIVLGTSSGELTYNRSISVAKKYYNISSPVNGETVESYIGNNSLQPGNGNIGLYYYDNNTTSGFAGTGYIFYTPSSTGSFTSGKGYGTQVSTASDVTFTGTMPTADVSISVATGGSIDDSNLIGNPFPSYLPANESAVLTNNILTQNTSVLSEETLWFWDNTANDFVAINNGSPSYYVSPAQGFFVDASSTGSFSFLESWQEHQTTDVFYKGTDKIFRIKLNVSDNNETKSTQFYYFENKTIDFDNGYDSSQIEDEYATLNIFSRLVKNHDSKNLAIQTLPTENLDSYVIPIGIKGKEKLTFNAFVSNKPSDLNLFLEDRVTNTFLQLDNAVSQTIDLDTQINGIGRFYLHLQSKALNIDKNPINNISIFNSNYKEITLNGLPIGNSQVIIYDILGKKVKNEQFNINSNTSKIIPLLNLNEGFYIVNLKTENGFLSKKIILKN